MLSFRSLILLGLFSASLPTAFAGTRRPASNDTRHETEAPTLSAQVQAVRHTTATLVDVLRLSTAQARKLHACAKAELLSVALADTPEAVAAARQQHLLAVARILTPSQFAHYCSLHITLELPEALPQNVAQR